MVSFLAQATLLAALQLGATLPAGSRSSDCAAMMAEVDNSSTRELCEAEQQLAAAERQRADQSQPDRSRSLSAVAAVYERASANVRDVELRARLLGHLADIYDAKHLNDPAQMELTLRELIATKPADTAPLFRLARLQEDREQFDAAENTLMSARQMHQDEVETYRQLAQFYSRRVAALTSTAARTEASQREARQAGAPDSSGIYTVGGALAPPPREGVPRYPEAARIAGIDGAVLVELVVDESGAVSDARVVRSIPFLDDAALAAVKTWRFAPSVIDGRPVPVRMTVTVNFAK